MTFSAQQHPLGSNEPQHPQGYAAVQQQDVGEGRQDVRELSDAERQYLRDLETLDAAGGDGGCFFAAMGEIIARRLGC